MRGLGTGICELCRRILKREKDGKMDRRGRGRSCVVVQGREREGKGEVDSIVSECVEKEL